MQFLHFMTNPFMIDSGGRYCVRPIASLNSLIFRNTDALPRNIVNKSGYDLLSREAVLRLNEVYRDKAIPNEYGINLGKFLLGLTSGNPEIVEQPNWGPEHYRFWQGVKKVVLGGGTMNGIFGEVAVVMAESYLQAYGREIELIRDPDPSHIPVCGLSRLAEGESVLAIDFGNTKIKSAYATVEDRVVKSISIGRTLDASDASESMGVDNLVETINEFSLENPESDEIGIAIASYVVGGFVQSDRGKYGKFYGQDIQTTLSEKIGKNVYVVHDGTAAGTWYANTIDRAVVVMLGTAIGWSPIFYDPRLCDVDPELR
ncbi:MAG: hypothetical protein QG588_1407 [Candidatus Poribacteria bacterium]|nr:hypothetical protein [Candidatus Poribacteria bacterium]